MRILALPAALVLSFCLYLPLPQAAGAIAAALRRLYFAILRRFTNKDGTAEERLSLLIFLLLLAGISTLLGAIHPACAALVMTPLFAAASLLPHSVKVKEELDSGAFAGNIPEYESRVRTACASLGPAFVSDACVPLILCAVGIPLYLGCALGWMWFGLRALCEQNIAARRAVALALRPADAVFCALMLMCSGLVGRNPFRTRGAGSRDRLMSILGIVGDGTDTHAPMAGDITQATFLCCLCAALLCLLLTVIILAFCL